MTKFAGTANMIVHDVHEINYEIVQSRSQSLLLCQYILSCASVIIITMSTSKIKC